MTATKAATAAVAMCETMMKLKRISDQKFKKPPNFVRAENYQYLWIVEFFFVNKIISACDGNLSNFVWCCWSWEKKWTVVRLTHVLNPTEWQNVFIFLNYQTNNRVIEFEMSSFFDLTNKTLSPRKNTHFWLNERAHDMTLSC